ncbi:MAG: Gfo/Idh/MocA family oxidoreductase [Puniceicoccaceae bacterium]
MIRVGIVGLGFMGGVHLRHWQALPGVEVVAACDLKPQKSGAVKGNLGGSAQALNLEHLHLYTDAATLYANEQLDAVSITLPTFLHCDASIQALEAGVHVLCEKPMALNLHQCDAMIAAANQAGRHLMVAHCIRFWPAYAWLKQTAVAGTYGRLIAGDFNRIGAAPGWDSGSWFADPEKSGGIGLDLHIHDLDFVSYLCGTPERMQSWCTRSPSSGVAGEVRSVLEFAGGLQIGTLASWLMTPEFGFEMSFRAVFERAVVCYNSREGMGMQVIPADAPAYSPELNSCDGYPLEIQHFRDLISGAATEPVISAVQARNSVRLAIQSTQP